MKANRLLWLPRPGAGIPGLALLRPPLLPCCPEKLKERVMGAVGGGLDGSRDCKAPVSWRKLPVAAPFYLQAISSLAPFRRLGRGGCQKWAG